MMYKGAETIAVRPLFCTYVYFYLPSTDNASKTFPGMLPKNP